MRLFANTLNEEPAAAQTCADPNPMDNQQPIEQLPKELEECLQSLGGVQAPEELWHRVAMSLEGQAEAPDELWERIAPEVSAVARPVRRFPIRRLVSAAAVLLVAAISFLPQQPITNLESSAGLNLGGRAAKINIEEHNRLRDQFADQVLSREVNSSQLSAVSRAFAMAAGANPESPKGGSR